jgi:hypothetical protein
MQTPSPALNGPTLRGYPFWVHGLAALTQGVRTRLNIGSASPESGLTVFQKKNEEITGVYGVPYDMLTHHGGVILNTSHPLASAPANLNLG